MEMLGNFNTIQQDIVRSYSPSRLIAADRASHADLIAALPNRIQEQMRQRSNASDAKRIACQERAQMQARGSRPSKTTPKATALQAARQAQLAVNRLEAQLGLDREKLRNSPQARREALQVEAATIRRQMKGNR